MKMYRWSPLILAGLAFPGLLLIACDKDLPPESGPSQTPTVTYHDRDYAEALALHVTEDGWVQYAELKQNRSDLDQYTHRLATLSPEVYAAWNPEDQFAFWINAYNALTLQAVIDHYPLDSIKDLGSIVVSVWDKLTFDVLGTPYTLNQIEHDVLRADFKDPRLHMAINCASIGCPPLLNEPFAGAQLDAQFERQIRAFLGDPTKFKIDTGENTVYLSKIFSWFGDDFIPVYGGDTTLPKLSEQQTAVIRFISAFVPTKGQAFLQQGGFSVKYLDYDWDLNDRASAATRE